ncbi:outer membrane protein [Arsenicitalea aurantiaca]|nr:outer membrane protein [Arsenicitalea aurantiaca]
MNFVKQLALATAATAVMTASAFAADLYVPIEEPYIPEVSVLGWTGAYVGVHAGYGWGSFDEPDDATPEWANDIDGWLAGVQAGYNVNLDGVVLGVEGDIAWADIGSEEFTRDGLAGSIDWIGTIRGRVGFAADAFLIYGTAGVAFAGADLLDDPDADSNTHTGWVVGAGVEAMVTESVSLKAEYLYHDFGTQEYDFNGDTDDVDFQVSTVKIGLNFHF